MEKLTDKQAQFVREYLVDLNAKQAAIRCGYSEKSAETQGSRLYRNGEVRSAIETAIAKRADKSGITAERVLAEIANMAFYDIADTMIEIEGVEVEIHSSDGKLYGLRGPTDIRSLPENVRRAIVGYGWDKAGNFTIKLADKSKALDQLARHLSLYNDKLEVTGLDALADRMERAMKRGE